MRIFYAEDQRVSLPRGHRFPMRKFGLFREAFKEDENVELCVAPPAEPKEMLRVHDAGYVADALGGRLSAAMLNKIGLPWSEELAEFACATVNATLLASDAAFVDGISGNAGGGCHHVHAKQGGGYGVFNDLAIAAQRLLDLGRVEKVAILDVDVHQGNGTASIFAKNPRVVTVSVYGEQNFPFTKTKSDLDVPLPDNSGDAAYLEAVRRALSFILNEVHPECVFIQAGVDALAEDCLGRLHVSEAGLAYRDKIVLSELYCRKIPTVLTMGGGFADPIERSVSAHVQTFRTAAKLLTSEEGCPPSVLERCSHCE